MKMMNRWFTRYLHGIDNGVENDPKAWIVRENDHRIHPTPYQDYPNPEASNVTLHLQTGGSDIGGLSSEADKSQAKETLVDDSSISGRTLAMATRSKNRLLYVTPILKEDIHISGLPKITVRIACSKPAANLSVWLVSLPWNSDKGTKITDNIITKGWADLQNYQSISKSEPLKPGRFYEMTFDLQPDDQIINKGQQIGLMIFSSDLGHTILPKAGTELTVDLDRTTLTIPIVGGTVAFREATE